MPPATRTLPLVVAFDDVPSWVALCSRRAPVMLAVAAQVPVARSNSSAVESAVAPVAVVLRPPTTSTLPVDSGVAVCSWRAVAIEPVVVQRGSRSAGYATESGHDTRRVQEAAPGAVTALPHGAAGFASTAQPSTASAATVATPSAPRMVGGE